MPTFDFTCTACNTAFEKTMAFGAKGKPACPACKSKKTEKMISMPSVVFKGSGFYKTDSKTTKAPQQHPSAGADTGKNADSGKSADTEKTPTASTEKKVEVTSSEKKVAPATTPDAPAKA